MGMPQHTMLWTAEQVRAIPDDGNRYEVVDGELLVTPAPAKRHQRAVTERPEVLGETIEWHPVPDAGPLTIG